MRKAAAAAGSSAFFMAAPFVVAGVIPWVLTRWRVRELPVYWAPVRVAGAAVAAAAVVVLVRAFVRFVVEGRGTPAPVAPTEHLVVGGLYRHVRNPMYVAVVGCVLGQALAFGQPALLAYGALLMVVFAAFVHWYEEPALAEQFGQQYADYRAAVPAWRPRLSPWSPEPADGVQASD